MLTILLWIAQVLTPVSGQCMSLAKYVLPGEPELTLKSQRLEECIDMCLTNYLHVCKIIVFNHVQKTCKIHDKHYANKCKGCVVMKKMNCIDAVVDFRCFDYDTYQYAGLEYLYSIETERECRRICVLTIHCKGYTWLQRTNRCGLQVAKRKPKHKLKNGEVAAFTRPKCDNNRCIIMKFNSKTKGGERVNEATTFFECFQKLLLSDTVEVVDWQYQQKVCSHHTKDEVSVYANSKTRLQAIKQRQCHGKDPDVCMKKSPNSEMDGGFFIQKMAEQECITLCLHSVNCAAVTWSSYNECKFHHVIKKSYKNKSKYTDYVIEECSAKKAMENLLTKHYVYKGSNPVAEKFAPCCFKCAFRCQLDQCPGFTCFKEGEDLCTLDGIPEHSYVLKY